jgi:hypothetical protein
MTEKQLLARDAKRDIGAELLLSVRHMKAGKAIPSASRLAYPFPPSTSGSKGWPPSTSAKTPR